MTQLQFELVKRDKNEVKMRRFKVWFTFIFLSSVSAVASAIASPDKSAHEQSSANSAEAKYFSENCSACHSVGTSGGCLGPVLAGEGQRRTREFIESRISNDPAKVAAFQKLYGHAELMPHKRIAPAEAKKMADYIMALPGPDKGFAVKGHAKADVKVKVTTTKQASVGIASIIHGKQLVYEKGCLQCHSFGGVGGQFAPIFDGIGTRHKASYISDRINAAELLFANTDREYNERGIDMPPLGLNKKEIADITAYLSSLK
ncbi:MAG: cytochrome c [Candidatus Obscuribacterales bacterium]